MPKWIPKGNKRVRRCPVRVLMPVPDRDFDVTEVAVPWRLLTDAGHRVVFATEHAGTRPAGDPQLLRGVLFGQLGAAEEGTQFARGPGGLAARGTATDAPGVRGAGRQLSVRAPAWRCVPLRPPVPCASGSRTALRGQECPGRPAPRPVGSAGCPRSGGPRPAGKESVPIRPKVVTRRGTCP
ncbi:type 1 glutamine amidotransferase domain-containing protein [Streptomyces lydicamycinicus]|uniref:type 1 glutamine amidotransferase domain-containing protein n=2 Tax=Streptomyces lydicamycinicus TaxID=1546107 RepID=UPI003C2C7ED0